MPCAPVLVLCAGFNLRQSPALVQDTREAIRMPRIPVAYGVASNESAATKVGV